MKDFLKPSVPEAEGEPSPTIVRIDDPKMLLQEDMMEQYGLQKLISEGYEMTEEDADLREQVKIEYDHASIVFLALNKDGEAVGSLGYTFLTEEDQAVSDFLPRLRESDPALAAAISTESPAMYVRGIVVSPEYRGKRNEKGETIAGQLVREAVDSLQPALIIGETKTPQAVQIRANASGFRTFYGTHEVTPGDKTPTEKHLPILNAFLTVVPHMNEHFLRMDDSYGNDGVFLVRTDYLDPAVPMPRDNLVSAFSSVVAAQKNLTEQGVDATAVAPLISIREDIIS